MEKQIQKSPSYSSKLENIAEYGMDVTTGNDSFGSKMLQKNSLFPSAVSENVTPEMGAEDSRLDNSQQVKSTVQSLKDIGTNTSDLSHSGSNNLSSFSTWQAGNTSTNVDLSPDAIMSDNVLHTQSSLNSRLNSSSGSPENNNQVTFGSVGVGGNATGSFPNERATGAAGPSDSGQPQWARQSADISTSEWPQIHNLSVSYDYGGDWWLGELDDTFNRSGNHTLFPWTNGTTLEPVPEPYLSGYSLPHVIVTSIVVTMLMIIIVFGNALVIIAIAKDRHLKAIQNWFIASLAVSDLFVGW